MFSINTNVASLEAQSYLAKTSTFQQQTIQQVTSGLRIVNSGNDAAGLAVANGYASDEAVLTQGIANANDGIGQLQTVDGGENNISQLLNRASTLATQSASGTFTGSRTTLNNEFQSVLTEINREAQAIGLNQGGTLAQNLSVYIGGGQGATGSGIASGAANSQEQLNLSSSTVDAKSLGLVGVQVIGGTVGTTDIGTGSSTSVQNIVTNTANTATEATAGYTNFYVNGPGFSSTSGSTQIKLAVNLTGVTDANSLVAAVNSAITAEGAAGNQQATAFANANITATANTDSTGKTQLVLSSSSSAFQVTGGDQVANALLGNFATGSTGNTANPTVTGGTAVASTAGPAVPAVKLSFQGAGLTGTQTATVAITASETQAAMLTGVQAALTANTALAGITASLVSNKLVFTGPATQTFTVQATGDTNNNLGLGSYGVAGSTVTGAVAIGSSASQALQISVNGGASVSLGTLANGGSASTAAAAINSAIQSQAGAATLRAAGITATTNTTGAYVSATLAVGGANGVTFTAPPGVTGNSTTVTFVNPGANGTLGVVVSGSNITVNLGYAAGAVTSTATQVAAAIAASVPASALVTASATGVGSTLQAAAVSANLAGGTSATTTLQLTSGTGASFAVNAEGATNAFGLNADTSSTGVATSLASLQSGYGAGKATATDAQGENQSNTTSTGSGVGTDAFNFTSLTNAGDGQTVTLSATDSSGNAHSINVGLTAANAGTLDQALATINTALQTSNDSTLQSLAAFKQQSGTTNTTEGIRFASSAATFTASLGTTANGVGLTDTVSGSSVQGATNLLASSVYGTAGTANISNAASAAAAVSALTKAVSVLGNAQATVGRGENQFQYAANLASSQLTSDQAAESQIRDANIAQESANLTKASIQLQAGVAALAQANSAPQQLLSLLQGH